MTKLEARSDESRLRREVGWFLATLIAMNATLGTGIIRSPAAVAHLAGTTAWTIGMWCIGGVVTLAGALSLGEIGAALPRAGGMYEYLRRAYGPRVGFVFGWAKLFLLMPCIVGSFARLGAESVSALLGTPPTERGVAMLAVGFVVASLLPNLTGVRFSAIQQAVVTISKFLGVAALGIVGLTASSVPSSGSLMCLQRTTPVSSWAALLSAGVFVMWAFDGWTDLSALAGELKQPERSLPRALAACVVLVTALYVMVNWGLIHALGFNALACSDGGTGLATRLVATQAWGHRGAQLFDSIVAVSCLGGCMGSLLTGSRVLVPICTDNLLPKWLGRVSPEGVPRTPVLVGAVLAGCYASQWGYQQLAGALILGYFPFYIVAVAAVYVLRRREPELTRPFHVPGYPVTPMVFLMGATAVVWGTLNLKDQGIVIALAVLLSGIPASWLRLRRSSADRESLSVE